MNELASDHVFGWAMTLITGGVAGTWGIVDAFRLWRVRNGDRSDGVVRDKQFGYSIGVLIGVIGVVGCLRFQGVI